MPNLNFPGEDKAMVGPSAKHALELCKGGENRRHSQRIGTCAGAESHGP